MNIYRDNVYFKCSLFVIKIMEAMLNIHSYQLDILRKSFHVKTNYFIETVGKII